jgi:hypothetical protein
MIVRAERAAAGAVREGMRRHALALALGFALLASPVPAQDAAEPAREDFSTWAKGRIAELETELEALKLQVAELAAQAKPMAERARERFEAERPGLEAAGESFWEKVKDAAATLRDELRAFFDTEPAGEGEQRAQR